MTSKPDTRTVVAFDLRDVIVSTFRAGRGQIAIRMSHLPTGWTVESDPGWDGLESEERERLLKKLEQLVGAKAL